MLKLYTARNSICTQKVFMTLDEKSLPFETELVNLFTNEQYDSEYLKLNPKGVVPTLIDDGRAVIESTLICEYLDEIYPETSLVPADPYRRTRMRLWSKLIDEQIFESTREITFSAQFREKMKGMTEAQRQIRYANVGDPERRSRMMSTFEHGVASPYVALSVANFEKAFKSMETALGATGDGGPWLLGADYSLADINLTPYVARMEYLNLLNHWLGDRPFVRQWWVAAKARPSFVAAIADRLSEDEITDMWRFGSAIRDAIGQHRRDYLELMVRE